MSHPSAVLWLLTLVCCAGASAAREPGPEEGVAVGGSLRAAGLRRVHQERGFLAPGQRHSFAVEVPGGCAAVVSASAPGLRDLDLAVYDPEGTLLGEDVEPDDHPTVRWCGDGGRVYVVARAYEGAGRYELAVWTGDAPSMRAALGDVPAPAALSELEEALRGRGLRTLRRERWIDLPAAGEPVRFPVQLRPGRCIAVVAEASVSLELAVELESRTLDEAPGRQVAITTCADRGQATASVRGPAPARVRVRVLEGASAEVGGEGALWLGTSQAQRGASPALPAGWVVAARGEGRWSAGRAQSFDGCGRLQVWIARGGGELTLWVGGRLVARGSALVADVCGQSSVVSDAPARVAWRWLSREAP